MEPTLQYLIPVRDLATTTDIGSELILIRPFDTVFILANQESVVYSFHVVGRIFLNREGLISSGIKINLLDSEQKQIRSVSLAEQTISGERGVNIPAYFPNIQFSKEGKYTLEVEVSIDGVEYKKIGTPSYFMVKKLT